MYDLSLMQTAEYRRLDSIREVERDALASRFRGSTGGIVSWWRWLAGTLPVVATILLASGLLVRS